MLRKKHYRCMKYIDYISDILENPDYIGINPNEKGVSFEVVKCYKDNIILGIKLSSNEDYLYISTIFDIQQEKIIRRLHSGRLKEYLINKNE